MSTKLFYFPEFEVNSATVQTPTVTSDVMMGASNAWATKTAVGTSGVITGSLQSLGGQRQQDLVARFAAVVDYAYHIAKGMTNVTQISNGDRLVVAGVNFDVQHSEDETAVGLSNVLYLHRID